MNAKSVGPGLGKLFTTKSSGGIERSEMVVPEKWVSEEINRMSWRQIGNVALKNLPFVMRDFFSKALLAVRLSEGDRDYAPGRGGYYICVYNCERGKTGKHFSYLYRLEKREQFGDRFGGAYAQIATYNRVRASRVAKNHTIRIFYSEVFNQVNTQAFLKSQFRGNFRWDHTL